MHFVYLGPNNKWLIYVDMNHESRKNKGLKINKCIFKWGSFHLEDKRDFSYHNSERWYNLRKELCKCSQLVRKEFGFENFEINLICGPVLMNVKKKEEEEENAFSIKKNPLPAPSPLPYNLYRLELMRRQGCREPANEGAPPSLVTKPEVFDGSAVKS